MANKQGYWKNKKFSLAHRENLSRAHIGIFPTEETKNKLKKAMLQRIPVKNFTMKGKKHSDETKLKMSKSQKGKKHSDETKLKMSLSKKGKTPWNKNKKNIYSKKYIEKLKVSHTGKIKENASNWQGGKSFEKYSTKWDQALKKYIKKRDSNKCQNPNCSKKGKLKDVHHIDYKKENCKEKNLITLCRSCHAKSNGNRKYWNTYYKKIIRGIYGLGCKKISF